jgi:rod shape-determining protein MreB
MEGRAFICLPKTIGIDLGTANTLIFAKGKGIIMREPSVWRSITRNRYRRYVGKEAKDVIGRTPGSIVAAVAQGRRHRGF